MLIMCVFELIRTQRAREIEGNTMAKAAKKKVAAKKKPMKKTAKRRTAKKRARR
jgi:hypothetical protein